MLDLNFDPKNVCHIENLENEYYSFHWMRLRMRLLHSDQSGRSRGWSRVSTYYSSKISQKLREIDKILVRGGRGRKPPPDSSMQILLWIISLGRSLGSSSSLYCLSWFAAPRFQHHWSQWQQDRKTLKQKISLYLKLNTLMSGTLNQRTQMLDFNHPETMGTERN